MVHVSGHIAADVGQDAKKRVVSVMLPGRYRLGGEISLIAKTVWYFSVNSRLPEIEVI